MAKGYFVVVDIGATKIRVALSNSAGQFIKEVTVSTPQNSSNDVSNKLIEIIHSFRSLYSGKASLLGIGIGSIGPLDMEKGVILNTPNLQVKNIPVVKPLQDEFNLPVSFLNDCTAAVMGEKFLGAGKGVRNLVYITLSTGIGGGVYVDDHLLMGKDGNAAEVGHFTVDSVMNLLCNCGGVGHWEAYCSGKNIPDFVRYKMEEFSDDAVQRSYLNRACGGDLEKITTELFFEGVKMHDEVCSRILDEMNELNARGFANVINAYDPELITVGGAIMLNNYEYILEPIKERVRKYAINRVPKIIVTPLGENIVLLGALTSIMQKIDKHSRAE